MLVCIGTSREGGFAGEPAGGGGYSNAGLDWGARDCLVGSIERCVLHRVNQGEFQVMGNETYPAFVVLEGPSSRVLVETVGSCVGSEF